MTLNAELIAGLSTKLRRGRAHEFVSACRIVKEDEEIGLVDLRPQQLQVLDAWELYRWIYCCKYRQAKISTATVLALLGMVQYGEGLQAVFVAERYETGETVWNRATYAYQHQPPAVRIPLKSGTGTASRTMRFAHNGSIRVVSGGGAAPAIGNSPDRVVVTEYPDVTDHERFNGHFFPTVNKRPNARVLFEATPGMAGTIPETMWLKALSGESRFHPVFLKWWLDDSLAVYDESGQRRSFADFHATNEELRLAEDMPGITPDHFMFRRYALDTEFHGDIEQFTHKYPSTPLDGWLTTESPSIPRDAVTRLLAESIQHKDGEYMVFEQPDEDPAHPYCIVADPAGYGEAGDPSALTVFSGWEKKEVASWSGREDPGTFADRLLRVQKQYGVDRTLLVVESNKGECIASLVSRGARNLWMTSDSHPGYYSTAQSNADGHVALVDMLRNGELLIRSRSTVMQLLQWDGQSRKKRSSTTEGRHHFDRAVTCRMFAHVARLRAFGVRPVRREPGRGMTAKEFDRMFKKPPKNVLGVHA